MSIAVLFFLSHPGVGVFLGIEHALGQQFVVFHLPILQFHKVATNTLLLISKVGNRQLVFFQQQFKAFANANKLAFGLFCQCPHGLNVTLKRLFVGH